MPLFYFSQHFQSTYDGHLKNVIVCVHSGGVKISGNNLYLYTCMLTPLTSKPFISRAVPNAFFPHLKLLLGFSSAALTVILHDAISLNIEKKNSLPSE